MTKDTALRKSIHVFEGLRRMLSVSENGLTPDKGCADSFQAIDETVQTLKEMLRELQDGSITLKKELTEGFEKHLKEWQGEIIANGPPERLDFKEEEATTAEIEGGGSTWWIVCGECRGQIDTNDHYCKHCGRKVRWS